MPNIILVAAFLLVTKFFDASGHITGRVVLFLNPETMQPFTSLEDCQKHIVPKDGEQAECVTVKPVQEDET